MTKEEMLRNEALEAHMLSFAPLHKKPVFEPGKDGGRPNIYYVPEKTGVRVLERRSSISTRRRRRKSP